MFELPDVLPETRDELDQLRVAATAEIGEFRTRFDDGEEMSTDDLGRLTYLTDAVETLNGAIDALEVDETETTAADREAVNAAIERASAITAPPAPAESAPPAAPPAPAASAAAAGAQEGVDFSGLGGDDAPTGPTGPGWVMSPGAPGYREGKVGFREMGLAIDSVRGAGRTRPNRSDVRGMAARGLATLSRQMTVVNDSHELVAEIERVTSVLPGGNRVTAEALVAAGGWCAPSEQLYDFCDVPNATDLLSLPEIAINRGGIRWPIEPDLSAIFESFEFFFTEPELEAVDGNGDPTAFKHCVEIPCPDEFAEIRLNAVGYCVEAGILQRQGWPESIEWFLRSLTQEHLRAMSRRSILDMWNGGGAPKLFSVAHQVGATSGVLNSLALAATNIRLNKGYGRTAAMELVAPSWFFEVLRADMAMMEGIDTKDVSDAQILSWLSSRHIAGQFVGDWQTRDVGLPGHLDTVRWPGHVDVMLYPAGTWFRSLSNIIEIGVLYPKEQLQINRYTEFFTEDAYAIGKRCDRSVNLRVPLNVNGGHGAPVTIAYTDTDPDLGKGVSGAPVKGGGAGGKVTKTLTISGGPTGGNYKVQYQGEKTATIAHNANAAAIKAAIVALDDAYDGMVNVTGAGPFTVTVPTGAEISVTDVALTGGTTPAATLS